jgi:hypothetical protein
LGKLLAEILARNLCGGIFDSITACILQEQSRGGKNEKRLSG